MVNLRFCQFYHNKKKFEAFKRQKQKTPDAEKSCNKGSSYAPFKGTVLCKHHLHESHFDPSRGAISNPIPQMRKLRLEREALDWDKRVHELTAEILSPSPPDKSIFLVYPLPHPTRILALPPPQGFCLLCSRLSPHDWHYAWTQQVLSKTCEQSQQEDADYLLLQPFHGKQRHSKVK